jgi:trehalose 6-phosphate phosphatase
MSAPGTALPRPSTDWALFLDVDGTLLDIAETPSAVEVPSGMVELLASLQRELEGALALVSGRSLETLDRLFQPLRFAAAGQHGLERRCADGVVTYSGVAADAIDRVRWRLSAVEKEMPGTLLEDKGGTVTVHYRRSAVSKAQVLARVENAVSDLRSELELLASKKALEVRPRGVGKDKVVEAFMDEVPFRGRVPVFIGDDRTDEDGFLAVNRRGGHSVHVGAEVATAAFHRLADAAAVREWLAVAAAEIARVGRGRDAGAGPAAR